MLRKYMGRLCYVLLDGSYPNSMIRYVHPVPGLKPYALVANGKLEHVKCVYCKQPATAPGVYELNGVCNEHG